MPYSGQELLGHILALPVGDHDILGGNQILHIPPSGACRVLLQPDLVTWHHLQFDDHVRERQLGEDLVHREIQPEPLRSRQGESKVSLLAPRRLYGHVGLHGQGLALLLAALECLHVLEKSSLPLLWREAAHRAETIRKS